MVSQSVTLGTRTGEAGQQGAQGSEHRGGDAHLQQPGLVSLEKKP